jgi:hypothetical protein
MLYLSIVQVKNHGHGCNKEMYKKLPPHLHTDSLETLDKLTEESKTIYLL